MKASFRKLELQSELKEIRWRKILIINMTIN